MTWIIKLGGSVITRAGGSPYDLENTQRLAEEIAPFVKNTILVHGTGHVGKPYAITHDFLHDGLISADRQLLACEIRNALRRLNVDVVDTLRNAGIAAYGVQAATYFGENMNDVRFESSQRELRRQMSLGHVPVFFGDLMPLSDGTFQVFSSDQMTANLAEQLGPDNVVFLTDVAGVFGLDKQPLSHISRENLDCAYDGNSDSSDVSGGMRSKLKHALRAAKYAKACVIASGREPGIVRGVLSGDRVSCTVVLAEI